MIRDSLVSFARTIASVRITAQEKEDAKKRNAFAKKDLKEGHANFRLFAKENAKGKDGVYGETAFAIKDL